MSEQTHYSMLPTGFLLAGRYRIDQYLSSGECGNTYLVTDMKFASSRTRVVIKEFFLAERTYRSSGSSRVVVTNPDNQALVTKLREKFKREAKFIFSLKHPNIVSVSDYFDANDTSYYVMQYVEGGSLAKKLEDEGPLSEEDALRYIRQVLSALYVMHAEGLYHLDLKPANIMLDAYDNAKLIDFGASKIADDDSGKFSTTTPLYTRGFAPTEQVEGVLSRFGAWTDIYAVGATLYNLLSGMAPPMPSEILERGEETLTLPDDVSQRTKKAIAAFMQQNMRQRPQNVEEAEVLLFGKAQKHIRAIPGDNAIGEDFETQLPDEPKDVTRNDMPIQNEKGSHTNKWLYGIIAFLLAVIAGGGFLLLHKKGTSYTAKENLMVLPTDSSSVTDSTKTEDISAQDQDIFTIVYADSYDDFVNVREQPSSKARILTKLYPMFHGLGSGVLRGHRGSWAKVSVGEITGWAYTKYIGQETWYSGERPRRLVAAKSSTPIYVESYSDEPGLPLFTTVPKGTIIADDFEENDSYYVLITAHDYLFIRKTDVKVVDVRQQEVDNTPVRTIDGGVQVINGAGLRTYSVVVGSFVSQANAEGLCNQLRQAGRDARVIKTNETINGHTGWFRVIASSYDSKASAAQSRNELSAQYPAWLLYSK